ncbi:hypothetical protein J437_LFUL008903, partial [Ladona fulva]
MLNKCIQLFNNLLYIHVSIQRRDVRLLVGAVYLPPKSCHVLFESHCSAIESLLTNSRFSDILIAGDFNLPVSQAEDRLLPEESSGYHPALTFSIELHCDLNITNNSYFIYNYKKCNTE